MSIQDSFTPITTLKTSSKVLTVSTDLDLNNLDNTIEIMLSNIYGELLTGMSVKVYNVDTKFTPTGNLLITIYYKIIES